MDRGFPRIIFDTSVVPTVLLMLPSKNLREPHYPQESSFKDGYHKY